jgi:hypothetical protein
VKWQGAFFGVAPGLKVQWAWAAAVYHNSNFGADYSAIGVKPVDDTKASIYLNSDHAGTPENFKKYLVGGATGGGGSNFTGGYSASPNVVLMPSPSNITPGCGGS